jgi:guanylate kinase
LTYAPHFDKVIVNDKLEDSFSQAEKIVTDFYNE